MSGEVREAVRAALRRAVPSLGDARVAALEVGVWNWALLESDARGAPRVLDAQLADDYRRRAAHCAANLAPPPLGNGNAWLLPRVLGGDTEPYDVPFLRPHELNRPLLELHTRVKRRRDLHDRAAYVSVATLFECPSCGGRRCTFRQLQTRSGDEGSTVFVTCLRCKHEWVDSS